MNNVQKIIKEICDEKDIKFKLLSKDWIMMLEKDNKFQEFPDSWGINQDKDPGYFNYPKWHLETR